MNVEDEHPASGGRSSQGLKTLNHWLEEEAIQGEVTLAAIKKVIAAQLEQQMREQHISKSELARRMNTSRTQVDRILDPSRDVNVGTLSRAAGIVGRKVRLELI